MKQLASAVGVLLGTLAMFALLVRLQPFDLEIGRASCRERV